MNREEIKKLSNKYLEQLLCSLNYCDKELLREYDERYHDGRIKFGDPIPQDKIVEFIRNKYAEKRRKKAS